jgi:hypothetical protein
MASTPNGSVTRFAEQLAARNAGPNPPPPPAVGAHSPFEEVLVRDLAASLPTELAARLTAWGSAPPSDASPIPPVTSLSDLHDWLAVGALYRWVAHDSVLAREFLREVGRDPRNAGLALAHSLAARVGPPSRTAGWHVCDRVGLILQCLLAGLFLTGRGLLIFVVGHYALYGVGPIAIRPEDILSGIADIRVYSGLLPSGLAGYLAIGCAALWLAFEARVAPHLMEAARRLPVSVAGYGVTSSWRADTFYTLWFCQALACLLSICGSYCFRVSSGVAPSGGLGEMAVAVALTALACVVVARARSVLSLGSSGSGGTTSELGLTAVRDV